MATQTYGSIAASTGYRGGIGGNNPGNIPSAQSPSMDTIVQGLANQYQRPENNPNNYDPNSPAVLALNRQLVPNSVPANSGIATPQFQNLQHYLSTITPFNGASSLMNYLGSMSPQ